MHGSTYWAWFYSRIAEIKTICAYPSQKNKRRAMIILDGFYVFSFTFGARLMDADGEKTC